MGTKNIEGTLKVNNREVATLDPGTGYWSSALVGTNLSGKTIYFDTANTYSSFTFYSNATFTTTGGYTIEVQGPPNVFITGPNQTYIQVYQYSPSEWKLDSYTFPDDFGTITAFTSKAAIDTLNAMTLRIEGVELISKTLSQSLYESNVITGSALDPSLLAQGVYFWMYTGTKTVLYSSSPNSTFTVDGGVMEVVITHLSGNLYYRIQPLAYKSITNPFDLKIYYGTRLLNTGGGNYSVVDFNTITRSQYTDSSTVVTTLNTTNYKQPGKYFFTLSMEAEPKGMGVNSRVMLETISGWEKVDNNNPLVMQKLCYLDNGYEYRRTVVFNSNPSYGSWTKL